MQMIRNYSFHLWPKTCNQQIVYFDNNFTNQFADEECKKKWNFIRDGYNRFKNKHKLGTGSDAPRNSKHQTHQQLLFLDGVSQNRSGGSNIPMSQQELTENEEDADQLSSE